MSVKVTKDIVSKVLAGITSLTSKTILVGIPEDTTGRQDDERGPMNNATLGYIHEHGSPAQNIPARPFLVPGVKDAEDEITAKLKAGASKALSGDKGGAEVAMKAAGQIAEEAVKERFYSGDFAPLAKSTVQARARRGRKGAKEELASHAAGNAPNAENARPLIDTGALRDSIRYVIRKK